MIFYENVRAAWFLFLAFIVANFSCKVFNFCDLRLAFFFAAASCITILTVFIRTLWVGFIFTDCHISIFLSSALIAFQVLIFLNDGINFLNFIIWIILFILLHFKNWLYLFKLVLNILPSFLGRVKLFP